MSTIALSLGSGTQMYRAFGRPDANGPAIVLLHGISSGSGSWVPLAESLDGFRLLAWDAPGYGCSHGVDCLQPSAADYAERLEQWLTALELEDCIVVGHSLGALMATAHVSRYPDRVRGLVLADPAQGYRHDSAEKRDQVYHSRWPELERLGPEAYARKRAPRLLRPDAPAHCLNRVQDQIRRLNLDGFRRANWMLAHDALDQYLPMPAGLPGMVLCGAEDAITPPADVRALAGALDWPYIELARAGHASYIDNPEDFAAVLGQFTRRVAAGQPAL